MPVLGLLLLLAAAPSAPDALLEEASSARARGDVDRVRWCVLGWASLTRSSAPPSGFTGLESLMVDAAQAGPFRLFGSRLDDRVRVGLHDPHGLVGELIVTMVHGDARRRLSPIDALTPGRLEFGWNRPIPIDATIAIEAVMTKLGADMTLRRIVIGPVNDVALPKGPQIESSTTAAVETGDRRQIDASVSWWLLGLGILAAGLAGAAVWQETRF